jgi:hypothetical protein
MLTSARTSGGAGRASILIGATLLYAYVAVRAANLSFTHDEGFTYTRHVHDSFTAILHYRDLNANNHLLNTLAMKLSGGVLGSSELALRAPNVVAFAVYLVAMIALLRRVEHWAVRILGFSLALLNPYLLEFFSLARGYGLAVALVTASSLFTLRCVERPSVRAALVAALLAAFAVLASFPTIVYFLAVLLVIALVRFLPPAGNDGLPLGRLCAALAIPVVGVAVFALRPLMRLRRASELYAGGDDGFWQDTVYSLVSSTFHRRGWEVVDVTVVVLIGVLVVAGAAATVVSISRRTLPLHATAFVLLSTAAGVTVVQHVALDSLYLMERTALFLIPLFAIWLAFAADALALHPRAATAVMTASLVVAVAMSANLAAAANFSYALDWRYDARTERMIEDLDRMRGGRPTDLGATWLFEPAINYYVEARRLSWLSPIPRDCRGVCVTSTSDYYYVIGPDVAVVRQRGAQVVREYPLSASVLTRDIGVRE